MSIIKAIPEIANVFFMCLLTPHIIISPLYSLTCLYLPKSKPIPLESINVTNDKSKTTKSHLLLANISVIAFLYLIHNFVSFMKTN